MKPLLLQHLSGEPIGRFPVWMMRQAGRYLPQYRAVRKEHSFWKMVTTPELAAKVSLQPIEVFPLDAVILFSDILSLPYGLGIEIEMQESVGPVIVSPLRNIQAFSAFGSFDPKKHTGFVGEALARVRERMPSEKALLGFAGAPWTVASYLIEGKMNRQFDSLKGWFYRDRAGLMTSLEYLEKATVSYLKYQAECGAHMVQLFDTWLSEMPRDFFAEFYLPMLNRIFASLREARVPSIYFSKNAHHLLDDFSQLSADVLSVDSLLSLGEVERRTGGKFSLQGNLDPILLLGEPPIVRRETRRLVAEARQLKKPAILNLGHGVLPGASVESVRAFIEEAQTLWI